MPHRDEKYSARLVQIVFRDSARLQVEAAEHANELGGPSSGPRSGCTTTETSTAP
ncbi:hypothetical protein [Streptomyces albiflavescens]|uniref:hypothetical protein n=1 Tax=Streptomyces albiflavescens TaxID=1623582 RepID=UPI00166B5679|nr:hypothetical protein [Streptomyces albiflavescens]